MFLKEASARSGVITSEVGETSFDFKNKPFFHILNPSLIQGVVLDKLKIARVVPISKTGNDAMLLITYHCQCNQSFSKIWQKVMYN